MIKPDWQEFAKQHNMNPDEFADEIIKTAASLMLVNMDLDKYTHATCSMGNETQDINLTLTVKDKEVTDETNKD